MRSPVRMPHSSSDQLAARCYFPTTARICKPSHKVAHLSNTLSSSHNHESHESKQCIKQGSPSGPSGIHMPLLL